MASAPKNWRDWMPLHIEDLLNSEDIFAMTSDEFKGYMLLICHQWKSDDGYLPLNEDVLRKRSRLNREAWEASKTAILEKFERSEAGYSNPRCRAELNRVLLKHTNSQENARETTRKREERKHAERTQRVTERTQHHAPYSLSLSPSLSPSSSGSERQVPVLEEGKIERLVEEQRQEQFTKAIAEDLKESSDDCANSVNRVPIPLEIPLDTARRDSLAQGEIRGAGLPANSQQGRVEAPESGIQAVFVQKQPEYAEWPADLDPAVAVGSLLKSHPRPTSGYLSINAASEAIERLTPEYGKYGAYLYLMDRFAAYKAATDTWPVGRRGFIAGAEKFLNEEIYEQDETIWGKANDDHDDGTREIRAREQARRDRPDDSRPVPLPGPEELKRLQADARLAAYGPRPGASGVRAF